MPLFTATDIGATGTIQEWTVPKTATWTIEAAGAQGGGTVGGCGARLYGLFELQQGDVLQIIAGQHGVPIGQGNGTGSNNASGGGASAVILNGQPLMVAGGGAGAMDASHEPRHGRAGEDGGPSTQSANQGTDGQGSPGSLSGSYGGAGWLSGNGGSATALNDTALGCTSGAFNDGGFGGGGSTSSGGNNSRTAGGGGYSGGGYANTSGNQSGGGGGSYNAGTNQINLAGDDADGNFGDGWVNIYTPTVVAGTIYDEEGEPCQRAVYAMTRPTDGSAPQLLGHTLSDPVTGEYELRVNVEEEVTRVVVSEADDNPLLNDLVDRVMPGEA